jgi:sugar lactone lactonase YvrE
MPLGEHVYFAQNSFGSGRIARVARAGGDVEPLADSPSASDLAIAGDFLYWVDPGLSTQTGQIFRAALDGTNVTLLAEGLEQPGDIALDAEFVYFSSSGESCSAGPEGASCTGGGIRRVPRAGGAPELVLSTGALGGFWLDSDGLYWFASFPPRLMVAPPFGTEREIANVLSEGVGPLTADGDALYWPSGDKVLRLPFEDENVTRLITNLDGASAIAVRDDWVYVAESAAGRILRVATDGSANRPAGPITGPCPEPIGSVEELALSPRPDTNLEQLALSLEPGNVIASQAAYDRVVADVAAIRALVPDRADIGYLAPDDGKTVYLGLSDVAAQSILAGEYSAWDCLNERYGASLGEPNEAFFGSSSMLITLRGIYDISLVAERYAALPGVTGAGANSAAGDGPTVCVARDGERYQYVIDRAGGDCPSGCTEHDARAFASDAAGQVTSLGAWVSESGQPAPAWFGICR